MKLDQFMIALAIFGLFVLGGIFLIGDINNNYDSVNMSTEDFGEVYNITEDVYNTSQDMKDSTFGSDITDEDALDASIKGSFSAVRQVSNTFKLVGAIVNAIAAKLQIPGFVVIIAMTVLMISVVFGIMLLVLRIRA